MRREREYVCVIYILGNTNHDFILQELNYSPLSEIRSETDRVYACSRCLYLETTTMILFRKNVVRNPLQSSKFLTCYDRQMCVSL